MEIKNNLTSTIKVIQLYIHSLAEQLYGEDAME
jgi:hypothetical protein